MTRHAPELHPDVLAAASAAEFAGACRRPVGAGSGCALPPGHTGDCSDRADTGTWVRYLVAATVSALRDAGYAVAPVAARRTEWRAHAAAGQPEPRPDIACCPEEAHARQDLAEAAAPAKLWRREVLFGPWEPAVGR
jgi:hypothetical protein